jgi:DNA-binding transcriptional MocR family regulator
MQSGGYDRLLRHVRRVYAHNVARMSQAVMIHFPKGTRVTRPAGGFILWCQLPEKVDSLQLFKSALKAGITLAPGAIFSAKQQYQNFIRLNAACWSEEIEHAIARLGKLIAEPAGK